MVYLRTLENAKKRYVIANEFYPNNEAIFKIRDDEIRSDIFLSEGTCNFLLVLKFETNMDLTALYFTASHLKETYPDRKIYLAMPYIPYSRMDRKIRGYMFSLKYFAKFINSIGFEQVFVIAPHSEVSMALIDRCVEIPIQSHLNEILAILDDYKMKTPVDYIFYPDNGACKRYTEVLHMMRPYFFGNKKRNLDTGEIIDYELIGKPDDLNGKTVLIIDDLSSKGTTFYNAALKLRAAGAAHVYLYVSHYENSIYNGKLIRDRVVDKVFTTDSILSDWSSDLFQKLDIVFNVQDKNGKNIVVNL